MKDLHDFVIYLLVDVIYDVYFLYVHVVGVIRSSVLTWPLHFVSHFSCLFSTESMFPTKEVCEEQQLQQRRLDGEYIIMDHSSQSAHC